MRCTLPVPFTMDIIDFGTETVLSQFDCSCVNGDECARLNFSKGICFFLQVRQQAVKGKRYGRFDMIRFYCVVTGN